MSAKDGGPAFPAKNYAIPDYLRAEHVFELQATRGMTLRDYFAAKALTGLIGRVWAEEHGKVPAYLFDTWAKAAYITADAMLAAREAK